jgi:hypothetical protein
MLPLTRSRGNETKEPCASCFVEKASVKQFKNVVLLLILLGLALLVYAAAFFSMK